MYSTIISAIQKSLEKGLSWIIDWVVDHNINIFKYNPFAESSNIKLSIELNHPKKAWLIFKILIIMNTINGV